MGEQLGAAIITGASRGIGASIAEALAAHGVPVGILARREAALTEVAERIRSRGGVVVYRSADVTRFEEVEAAIGDMIEELRRDHGARTTLLVNNAGRIDREVPLWEADPDQWRGVIETNLVGSFHSSRAAIPHMLGDAPVRVAEIVSGAGAKDWGNASAYISSKAAMIRNVGHLHEAGFELGLRSFAIAPGTVRTELSTSMELHRGRTEFTPVDLTTNLILAIHRGELDAWSGKYLRVTHDSRESLLAHERKHGGVSEGARRLAISPWGDDDPQLVESLVPKLG